MLQLAYTAYLQVIVLSILDVVMETATLQCKLMYTLSIFRLSFYLSSMLSWRLQYHSANQCIHDLFSGYRSMYPRYVMETAILYSVN